MFFLLVLCVCMLMKDIMERIVGSVMWALIGRKERIVLEIDAQKLDPQDDKRRQIFVGLLDRG